MDRIVLLATKFHQTIGGFESIRINLPNWRRAIFE